MNILVLIVLGFCFYGYIFVTQAAAFLVWIVFIGKTFLSFSMLSVQVLSVTKIKRLILAIQDLEINKPVWHQTLFIFVFFALNVVFQSLSTVLFDHFGKTI